MDGAGWKWVHDLIISHITKTPFSGLLFSSFYNLFCVDCKSSVAHEGN